MDEWKNPGGPGNQPEKDQGKKPEDSGSQSGKDQGKSPGAPGNQPGEDQGKNPGDPGQKDSFIREKIQEKPKKRRYLKKIALSAGLAVVFGGVAGFTFFLCAGIGGHGGDRENVTIPRDTEAGSTAQNPTETASAANPESLREAVEGMVQDYLSSQASQEEEKSRSCVERVSDLAAGIQSSLVTVTSTRADQDVFARTYERSEKTFGVVLAITGTDIRILTETSLEGVADSVHITLGSQKTYEAAYVSSDDTTGFAIVSLPVSSVSSEVLSTIQAAELGNSYSLQAGDMVVALGDPMGYVPSVGWGIISYIDPLHQGTDRNFRLIQTDISGDADAGGILINEKGQIVGWLTQRYADDTRPNLLQAISISDIKSLMEQVSNGAHPAMLGVKIQALKGNADLPDETDGTAEESSSITGDSQAESSSTADSAPASSREESRAAADASEAARPKSSSAAGNLEADAQKEGKSKTDTSAESSGAAEGSKAGSLSGSAPETEAQSNPQMKSSAERDKTGQTDASRTDASEAESGMALAPGETPTGLYVTDLVDGGPAYTAGIQNGDILVRLGNTRLCETADLSAVLESCQPGDSVTVTVMRLSRGRYVMQIFDVTLAAR